MLIPKILLISLIILTGTSNKNISLSEPIPVTSSVPTTGPLTPRQDSLPKHQQNLDKTSQKIQTDMNKNSNSLKQQLDNIEDNFEKISIRIEQSLKERLQASEKVRFMMGSINKKLQTIQQSLVQTQKSRASETNTKTNNPQKNPDLQDVYKKIEEINLQLAELAKSEPKPDYSINLVTLVIIITLFVILATSCAILFTLLHWKQFRKSMENSDYINVKSETDKMNQDK